MSELLNQWHRQKGRRTSQTRADYACAVTAYRSQSHGWKLALIVGAVLVLAAWSLK